MGPPDLMNTINEIFINKNTLPIFHPGTYKPNTLGIIGICLAIVIIIGLIAGLKICCCPNIDITQLCCQCKKPQEISKPKRQEMKTMGTQPKQEQAQVQEQVQEQEQEQEQE